MFVKARGFLRVVPLYYGSLLLQPTFDLLIIQERDEALSDLRQTAMERDTLRERLQVATETQMNERVAFDDKVEELHGRIRRLNNERIELEARVSLWLQSRSQGKSMVTVCMSRSQSKSMNTTKHTYYSMYYVYMASLYNKLAHIKNRVRLI